MMLAYPHDSFADVARRLNLVPRVIVAQEAIQDGAPEDARCVLADLERDVCKAIEQNEAELEEAA
jgi:hypothetical protein